MFEAYFSAFEIIFQPVNFLVLIAGVLIGLFVGIVPTIGSLFILPLLLPFAFFLPPQIMLILFAGICATVFIGGSITSILLNIPGTAPNAAAMLDGYPMTRKGQASRALGAAITSSILGGVLPVFLSLAMIPLILPMILAFGQPEMAALVICGLTFLATLSGKSVSRGLISGALGLLLSLVGFHSITGVHRFDFGSILLFEGINIVPLTLGLFGLTELFYLVLKRRSTISSKINSSALFGILQGAKDVWTHKWLWLRSTLIGHIIGIIPGIGSEVSSWVSYGQAKQTCKNPHEFGTGRVEGVIAPQAANNAGEAGDLLTTMSLGIPGSATMSFFLAVFLIAGISPGPQLMTEQLPLALALIITIAIAHIIGGLICLFFANKLARLASVNLDFLIPGVLIIALSGIYLATSSLSSFFLLIIFTFLGFFMKKYDYSRPTLIMGFVLGELFEKYTTLSLKIYGPFFFTRPIFLIIIAVAVIIILFPMIMKVIRKLSRKTEKC
jgi:putative tricarboxylic transport membrane protein